MSKVNQKLKYVYDGSFEGLLTVIFEIYELKIPPSSIEEEGNQIALFAEEEREVFTDFDKATRVLKSIEKKFGRGECKKLYKVFMSEDANRSKMLYRYIRLLIDFHEDRRTAYQLEEVLYVKQQLKKMRREVHRMHAFIRFQQSKTDIYFSIIEPDFNVLPFTVDHFRKRYSNQRWIIFDKRRGYGFSYDLKKMQLFEMQDEVLGSNMESILAEGETDYADWWRTYFKATNIVERKNMKLHLRHVPKRYWKYLTEKQ